MRHLQLILFAVLTLFSGPSAFAAMSPLSVSIVPPVQFPPSDYSVTGLRLSALWGHHRNFYGVDLGAIGNITDQEFVGVGISGVFNYTKGNTTALGLQLAGLSNVNLQKTSVYGIQAAAGFNYNKAASKVVGVQFALANVASHTNIYGVQIGVYNTANEVYGLQVGLINVAKNLHGLQIGLLNFHHTGLFYVSPILNFGF